jgi:hypothetical protein
MQQIEEFEKGKKMNEDAGILEANDGLLSQMKDMGFSEFGSRKALIATKNIGLDQAMDWYANNPNEQEPSPSELAEEKKKKKRKPRLIPLELQSLFTKMMYLNRLAISTEGTDLSPKHLQFLFSKPSICVDLTRKGFQWQGMDGRVQHDAHELNRLLIDALEKSLKHTKGETLCRNIYQGLLSYQTTCLTCHRVSTRSEPYYDLNVQIIGCEDLTKSLRTYCASEVLEGDSAYHCDNCRQKVTAHRRTVINRLPPVLTFSLNRFRIDKSTNWQRQKVTSSSSFPLILDWSPYLGESASVSAPLPVVTDPESVEVAKEASLLSSLKSHAIWIDEASTLALEIATTIIGRSLESNPQLSTAPELVELSLDDRLYIDDRIIGNYERNAASTSAVVHQQLQQQNMTEDEEMSCVPSELECKTYQLSTVIMHRGSAHSGHYFAYIRDTLDEGSWSLSMSAYDESSGNTTSKGADKDKPVQVQYIKTKDANRDVQYQVYESSALAVVLSILEEYGAPYNCQQTVSASDMSMACNTIAVSKDRILKEVSRIKGQAWTRCYRPIYGNFTDFLKSVEEILGSDDETGTTIFIVPAAYKKLVSISDSSQAEVTGTELTQPVNDSEEMMMGDESGATGGDSDEQIARTLQEEEYAKAPARSTRAGRGTSAGDDSSSSTSGAWETINKRGKRNKQSNKADVPVQVLIPAEKKAEDEAASTTATPSASPTAKHRSYLEKVLADKILGFFFGKFYEFNDSQVNAMPIKSLMKSFQGKDSAYLLVYRQLSTALPRLGKLSSAITPGTADIEKSAVSQVAPAYWSEKVMAMNQELLNQRAAYEKSSQNIKILIKFPAHVRYAYPVIYLHDHQMPTSTVEGAASVSLGAAGLEIAVHEKMKLSELSNLLQTNYASLLLALGIDTSSSSSASSDPMIFSIMRSVSTEMTSASNGHGQEVYQLIYKLAANTTIYDLQRDSDKTGKYLLFWRGFLPSVDDGSMIPVAPLSSPLLPLPIVCLSTSPPAPRVSMAEDEEQVQQQIDICDRVISKDGIYPAIHRVQNRIFYYPSDCTLEEACYRICELFSIPIANAIIHARCSDSSSIDRPTPKEHHPEVIDLSMDVVDSLPDDKGAKRLRKGGSNSTGIASGLDIPSSSSSPLQLMNRGVMIYKGADKQLSASSPLAPAVSLSGRPIRSVRNNISSSSLPTSIRPQDIPNLVEILVEDVTMSPASLLHSLAMIEHTQQQAVPVMIQLMNRKTPHELIMSMDQSWMVYLDRQLTIDVLKHHTMEHYHLQSNHHHTYVFFDYETSSSSAGGYQVKAIHPPRNESMSLESTPWVASKVLALAAFNEQEIQEYASSVAPLSPSKNSSIGIVVPETVMLKVHYESEAVYELQISTASTISSTKLEILQHFFPSTYHNFPTISYDSDTISIVPYYCLGAEPTGMIEYGAGSGKFVSSFRIHHATWNGDIGGMIDEYDDNEDDEYTWKAFFEAYPNIFASSAAASSSSSSSSSSVDVYLLPGQVAVKGRKQIPIYLWLHPHPALDHVNYINNSKRTTADDAMDVVIDEQQPQPLNPPDELALSKEEVSYLESLSNLKQAYLYPLGMLTCHDTNLLPDLYSYLYNHLIAQLPVLQSGFQYEDVSWLAACDSSEQIIIRDITPASLPGKGYWLNEPKAASTGAAANSLARIGMKGAAAKTVAGSGDAAAKSLKKVGLFNVKEKTSGLVIEILAQAQSKGGVPPAHAVQLWYHRLADDYDNEHSCIRFDPAYPPQAFLLSHGPAPNLAHLKRKLSELSSIPFESISVAKYEAMTATWREFVPGMRVTGGAKANGSGYGSAKKVIIGNGKKKGEDNLYELPYAVRDGDLFCVYDSSKHPSLNSDTASAPAAMDDGAMDSTAAAAERKISFARREDLLQQKVLALAAARKKKGSVSTRSKSDRKSVAVTPRREVNLSLGGNLDFSDDEDEEVEMME